MSCNIREKGTSYCLSWHEKLYTTGNDNHIFLANLFLKQGISWEYVIVDFICMGLLDLWGMRTVNYKMKNSCPQWDSNPGSSAYEANAVCVELLELINIDHLKVTTFYPSFLCKLPVPRGRCDIIQYLYRFAVWLIKTFADLKELLECITRQNIVLHLSRGTPYR